MGFGILLLGYLLLLPLPFFGGVDLHPIAYGICAAALLRLQSYEDAFRAPKWLTLPLIPLTAAVSGVYLLRHFGVNLLSDNILSLLEAGKTLLAVIFQLTLLWAMSRIARAVGLSELSHQCVGTMALVGVYFAAMIALNAPPIAAALRGAHPYALLIFDALWLLVLLFGALRIFACYRRICPEGDEDMPKKETRFDRALRRRREEKDELRREFNRHSSKKK